MRYRSRRRRIDATQWFKNGDHPEDGPADSEGRVVRYFRHPDISGTTICVMCDHIMHSHGWIDKGTHGIPVCPGNWIVSIQGKFLCYEPDVFAAMYERIKP